MVSQEKDDELSPRASMAAGTAVSRPAAELLEAAKIVLEAVDMVEDQAVTPERRNVALEIANASGARLARLAGLGLKARGVRRP